MGITHKKKTYQISCTIFLEKYSCLSPYDIDLMKVYTIDNEDIRFGGKVGYDLIGNSDHPGASSSFHQYFLIHDDMFDIILATDHNTYIALSITPKDVLFPSINNSTHSSYKLSKRSEIVSPPCQFQNKRHKIVNEYSINISLISSLLLFILHQK